MSDSTPHRVAMLAKNRMGQVTVCQCETVQLSLGPVTVRVPLSELATVAELLTEAVSTLSEGVALQASDHPTMMHN